MKIYLVCWEGSSDPTAIFCATLNLAIARKVAKAHAGAEDICIYAMDADRDYDWGLAEKVSLEDLG